MLLDFEENTKKLKKHNPKSTLTPRKSESEVLCEHCKKSFAPEKILKHIGHVKACITFYGPRFVELKKEQQRKRIEKFNSNLSDKQQQNILKRNRERYAKSSEKRPLRSTPCFNTISPRLFSTAQSYPALHVLVTIFLVLAKAMKDVQGMA